MSHKVAYTRLVLEGENPHRELPKYPEIISRVDRIQCREIENCCIQTLKIGEDPCIENRNVEPIIRRCLKDYANACTTCIIGKAGEECGVLSFDIDNTYSSSDLLDPDFPDNGRDIFPEDDDVRPEHVLSSLCSSRIEQIVRILKNMEQSWFTQNKISEENGFEICNRLWEYAKEESAEYIRQKFGAEKAEEFVIMGSSLFDETF